jgi:hypothetical protein
MIANAATRPIDARGERAPASELAQRANDTSNNAATRPIGEGASE